MGRECGGCVSAHVALLFLSSWIARILFTADAVFVAHVLRPALATARGFPASTSSVATFCFAEPVLRLQAIEPFATIAGVIFMERR